MKTAIIGLGNIGAQLAHLLVAGGEHIVVADRSDTKTAAVVKGSGGRAEAASVEGAIESSDVVILAVYFDAMKGLIEQHRDKLKNKIVVDPSNPVGPDGKGGMKKVIPENQSSGEAVAALLPPQAKFVKGFGTLGAESLKKGANRSPQPAVLFYASDDKAAGDRVAQLITAAGFSPVRIGGVDKSIRIEVFGDLHEFGKLGRLVSAEEAKALI